MEINVSKKAHCQILDNLLCGDVFYLEDDEEGEEVYMMLTTAAPDGEDLRCVELSTGVIKPVNCYANVVKVECKVYIVKPL